MKGEASLCIFGVKLDGLGYGVCATDGLVSKYDPYVICGMRNYPMSSLDKVTHVYKATTLSLV